MIRWFGAAVLVAVACASAACTPAVSTSIPASDSAAKDAMAGRTVAVAMSDMQFEPATVRVEAGAPVNVTAANKGVVEHNWVVSVENETIQLDARPGQRATRTFTPTAPGTYRIICSVPGHEQAGMTGTLVVE